MKRLTLLLPLALITACDRQAPAPVEPASVAVTVCQVQSEIYTPQMHFTGTVHASKEANVGASLPGRIEKIHVTEGQHVHKGQLLAELSDELLTTTEIEYRTLEKDFQRVKRLSENETVAIQKLDHVAAKYEAAKAKYELLLKNTRIRAPFDGVVVQRLLEEGEIFSFFPAIKPGYSHAMGIVRLMKLNPVHVEIEVGEKDLVRIKPGMNASISTDAWPEQCFQGQVTATQPLISTLSRTAMVKIATPNAENRLMPGMFARVTVEMPEVEACFIPRSAVLRTPGTALEFVYVNDNGHARRRPIVRGAEVGDRIAVTGLQAGDSVILAGKQRLKDGSAIEIGGRK